MRTGPIRRIGYANLITATRLVLVAVTGTALWLSPGVTLAWRTVVVGSGAALLDLADGWVARRTRTTTAFGARFDMEVDAALIMILSALAWRWEKAGGWVLLSGLLRYAFVAAGAVRPWMRAALPDSLRRKTVCVVQIGALIVILAPVARQPASGVAAAAALALLVWSFAVDTWWLWRASTPTAARGPAFPSSS